MPKVVSNTTPIISLLKLNQLDLLRQLYDQIYIPLAVYREIKAKMKGLIEDVKPMLQELIKKDVWISDKLKREILKKVGEE